MASGGEVKITLIIDSQGNAKIQETVKGIESIGQASQQAGGTGAAGFKKAADAAENLGNQMLGVLGVTLSVVGAAYLAEKAFTAWYNIISSGIGAVEDYKTSIYSASAMLTGLTDVKKEPDLSKAYGQWKDYFDWLWKESIEVDKKVAASQREIFEVSKELAKRQVVAMSREQVEIAGRLTDFMKQVTPQTGGGEQSFRNIMQIRQEIRDLLEGNVRMNAQTAVQFKQMDEHFSENIKKARRLGTVYEYLDTLLQGQKLATQDIANTWGSVSASLRSTWQQVQIRAFGDAYDDVVRFGQALLNTLIEGGELTERGKMLADALGLAWGRAKDKVAGLLNYIIDNGPEVIKNVETLAGAVGTIGGAAASAIVNISNLLNELKSLAENPLVQMLMGAAAGSRFGPFGAAIGAALGGAPGATGYLRGAGDFGFGALLAERPETPEDFRRYAFPMLGAIPPLPKTPAPPTPPLRRYAGEPDAGKGADAAQRKIENLIDSLTKEWSALSEGSIAQVDAWSEHMRKEIARVAGFAEEKAEADVMRQKVAELKKEKLVDNFYLRLAKESGDAFAQIDKDYKDDVTNFGKNAADKENIEWVRSKRVYDINYKQEQGLMGLQKASLDALAGSMPFLGQQLTYKEASLKIELAMGRAVLDQKIWEMELADQTRINQGLEPLITAELKNQLRVQQQQFEWAKKYALERERWMKAGAGGGLQVWAFERIQEMQTRGAREMIGIMRSAESFLGDAAGNALVDAFHGRKTDIKKIFSDLGDSVLRWGAKMAVQPIFDSIAGAIGIPGLGTKPDGSWAKPFYVVDMGAAGFGGLGLGGGLGQDGSTFAHEVTASADTFGGMVASSGQGFLSSVWQAGSSFVGVLGGLLGGGGGGGGILGFLGGLFGFHRGGQVPIYAHAGWPLSPDERLIVAQTGEGILPRPAMSRLGPARFEALRRGDVGGGDVHYHEYKIDAPFTATRPVTAQTFYHHRRSIEDMLQRERRHRGNR